jgi:hypothetical protein
MMYSKSCLNRTLNRSVFCRHQTLNKVGSVLNLTYINRTPVYDEYDCIVVHLSTNDLRVNNDSEDICNIFQNLIVKIHTTCPKAKIIISSGLLVNKADKENVNLNEKVTYCNVILRHVSLNSDYVEFCDNSSLNVKGKPNPRFLSHDNIHLKPRRVHGRQNNKHTYNSFERRYYRGPYYHQGYYGNG